MLRDFLDRFGFDYEFLSSTDCYASGRFDEALKAVLAHWDAIMGIMLPTLGEERRATYSPVLPISRRRAASCCRSRSKWSMRRPGIVALRGRRRADRAVDPRRAAKLQWKVDWAMRWVALGVDYEMSGKDLIESVVQSSKIARILGARPPEGFNYEMFLDEKGEKISKSKGNGLTIEEWLTYGTKESLAFYIYREPRKAKSLHLGRDPARGRRLLAVPRRLMPASRSSSSSATRSTISTTGRRRRRPSCRSPSGCCSTSSACSARRRRGAGAAAICSLRPRRRRDAPELDELIGLAVNYGRDFVTPTLKRRRARRDRGRALAELDARLAALTADAPAEAIQNEVYEIGKARYGSRALRDWFRALYETLLGSSQGPRMGSFIALYGIDNSRRLIAEALARDRA